MILALTTTELNKLIYKGFTTLQPIEYYGSHPIHDENYGVIYESIRFAYEGAGSVSSGLYNGFLRTKRVYLDVED